MEDVEHYNIPIYNFPYDVEEDDEDTIEENSELRALLPFAIIGSDEEINVGGRIVRGRQYPWGTVEGMQSIICRALVGMNDLILLKWTTLSIRISHAYDRLC